MSKYLAYPQIIFKDRGLLIAALADLGYTQVEDGQDLPLYGYRGDRRPETAELVVRREHIDSASNDLGFVRSPTATFRSSAITTSGLCSRAVSCRG